ncbi:MAG: RNA ligase family protein [Planctomycetota bacterium]
MRTLAEELTARVQANQGAAKEVVVFTEFLGDASFAGMHKENDPKRLVLIDVSLDGRMLPPEEFLELLEGLPVARVVYRGKLTGRFAEDVRCGRYSVEEGVVCKGEVDGRVWMAKIKTNAYMEKLKQQFSDKWEDYWE